jgi:hypothetical protein
MPHCAHLAGTEPGQLRMHRADQIGADLPKPCRGGFVVAALGGFLRFEMTAHAYALLVPLGSSRRSPDTSSSPAMTSATSSNSGST